ncbi:Signal peptidase complex catalytic subunit SEC11-like protein 2 [Colletotrichum kahawae]|uniref:Signal peptidase complex catalytic subunit SEC11 n=1 Tax=Colletotrichum kahawae TaxID=34407 RepID=A0AAD9YAM4_COLKA|nr:Signal peptidase complex catalytic subunit SEC11-like protein 2 [Colletotrichum kahawae]
MAWKALSLATNCAFPAMVVLSESMEPAFSRGDVILLANWQEVEVGDIPVIWFQGQRLPMVHRAVELFSRNRERLILTKGDNNEINDVAIYPFGQTHVRQDQVVGLVRGYIPYVGQLTITTQGLLSRFGSPLSFFRKMLRLS